MSDTSDRSETLPSEEMSETSPPEELVMSLATLSVDPFGLSFDELDSSLVATAAAGYTGVSVWPFNLGMAGVDVPWLVDRLEELHLTHPVAEAAFGWLNPDRDAAAAEVSNLVSYATAVGGRELVAVTMEPTLPPMGEVATRFRTLCRAAADAGLGVSMEFLPWTGIANLATAWEIIERADCDNSGIMVDTWHWLRQPGGPDPDRLGRIPSGMLRVVQLCDAPAEPPGGMDMATETMTARLLPGEGAVDFAEVIGIISDSGASPIWFPEVFSSTLAQAGPQIMASQVLAATRSVLGRTQRRSGC
ncbi:sugar phosphate isomerase/epimerase family protein [Candidatus Poriferisocius sp.]|uniref:sugar phosphate isomerase/epimerase family protein n=1 Tax=Candidatus Poriferisocius sp. TaxID=3101276 RepID=UPI003B019B75